MGKRRRTGCAADEALSAAHERLHQTGSRRDAERLLEKLI